MCVCVGVLVCFCVCRVEVAAAVGHEKPTAATRLNIKRGGDRRTLAQPCFARGGRYPQVLVW